MTSERRSSLPRLFVSANDAAPQNGVGGVELVTGPIYFKLAKAGTGLGSLFSSSSSQQPGQQARDWIRTHEPTTVPAAVSVASSSSDQSSSSASSSSSSQSKNISTKSPPRGLLKAASQVFNRSARRLSSSSISSPIPPPSASFLSPPKGFSFGFGTLDLSTCSIIISSSPYSEQLSASSSVLFSAPISPASNISSYTKSSTDSYLVIEFSSRQCLTFCSALPKPGGSGGGTNATATTTTTDAAPPVRPALQAPRVFNVLYKPNAYDRKRNSASSNEKCAVSVVAAPPPSPSLAAAGLDHGVALSSSSSSSSSSSCPPPLVALTSSEWSSLLKGVLLRLRQHVSASDISRIVVTKRHSSVGVHSSSSSSSSSPSTSTPAASSSRPPGDTDAAHASSADLASSEALRKLVGSKGNLTAEDLMSVRTIMLRASSMASRDEDLVSSVSDFGILPSPPPLAPKKVPLLSLPDALRLHHPRSKSFAHAPPPPGLAFESLSELYPLVELDDVLAMTLEAMLDARVISSNVSSPIPAPDDKQKKDFAGYDFESISSYGGGGSGRVTFSATTTTTTTTNTSDIALPPPPPSSVPSSLPPSSSASLSSSSSLVGGPHLKRLNELMSKKFLTPNEADEIKLLLVENLELTTPGGSWNKVDGDDERGSLCQASSGSGGNSVSYGVGGSQVRPGSSSKRLSGSALLRPLQTVPISKALARAASKVKEAASNARANLLQARAGGGDKVGAGATTTTTTGSLHEAREGDDVSDLGGGRAPEKARQAMSDIELLKPPEEDLTDQLMEQNLEAALDLKVLVTNISAPNAGPPATGAKGWKGKKKI